MLSDTPAVKRGSPNLAARTDTASRHSCEPPAPCHPACLLFTITSEQDNGGQKAHTIANSDLSTTDVSLDTKVWWSQTGSNRRPQACKASALPTELWPQFRHLNTNQRLVGLSGLEPLTSRLSGVCSNHLSYRPLSANRPSGRQLRTGNPEGQPIGSTEHIRGRKRNEAGARAERTSGYHERHLRCSKSCWSMCSNIEP